MRDSKGTLGVTLGEKPVRVVSGGLPRRQADPLQHLHLPRGVGAHLLRGVGAGLSAIRALFGTRCSPHVVF